MHLCILGKPGVTTSVLFERRKPLASISIEGVVGARRNLDITFPRFDKEDRKYFKIKHISHIQRTMGLNTWNHSNTMLIFQSCVVKYSCHTMNQNKIY